MRFLITVILLGTLFACKESVPKTKFISAPSLIEQQIAHIDTSLYSIKKFTTLDTSAPDTGFVRREDFRAEVAEFLLIPDLSDPKLARKFTEETRYDDMLKRVIVSYTPAEGNKEPFQQIEIFVEPNLSSGDPVRTILATRRKSDRNGFEQAEMIWQMDRSCTLILTTQKPAEEEHIRTTKWSWNE